MKSVRRLHAPSFDTGSDRHLVPAKLNLKKKIFKRDTHKPAPVRIPTLTSQELELAIETYDWKCLEYPSEDYDLLISRLLKCAESCCQTMSSLASRLDGHAMELWSKKEPSSWILALLIRKGSPSPRHVDLQ
ncbi:hypothetical protein Q1695_003653 [Nippostrongylus brasiliensis]|nr:hypothetical protein Q1695_003653 [Nippostrongylus brasiliensis]